MTSMTMAGSGSETRQSSERKSKWALACLASLVLGLLVYAAGFLVYSYSYHRVHWFGLGENVDIYVKGTEWGQWAEGVGVILFMLGIVLYVAVKRKGV